MFYIKSPYLTIPKIIDFGLQNYQIMKKCSSEMHQYELTDPVFEHCSLSTFSNNGINKGSMMKKALLLSQVTF